VTPTPHVAVEINLGPGQALKQQILERWNASPEPFQLGHSDDGTFLSSMARDDLRAFGFRPIDHLAEAVLGEVQRPSGHWGFPLNGSIYKS
jgi:hypothetical protein